MGYTCSNSNNDATSRTSGIPRGYDGLAGGYIGLGIDEYGNFLNQNDNTVTGNNYQPMRIGMRGPGNITWRSLTTAYPTQYPSGMSNSQKATAVQYACKYGAFQDWSAVVSSGSGSPIAYIPPLGTALPDYAMITQLLPNGTVAPAATVFPTGQFIANESATNRSQAIPITYNLKITADGILSLSYSYNGGALQNVISNQDITQGNAYPLPSNIRFGFAGSTGGSRNVHEVMCFQATPSNVSQSSAGLNQKQTAQVQQGTQVYFAYYNPVTLAGSVTSQYLDQDSTNTNILSIDPAVTWDASCALTGVATGTTCDVTGPAGPIAAQTSRTILSYNTVTNAPIAFRTASLPAGELTNLNNGDTVPLGVTRLAYLRGDRTNEQTPTSTTTFTGIYRARASVLGDVIGSSPTWVGPPNSPFPTTWVDLYHISGHPTDPLPENSASKTYANFSSVGSAGANREFSRTNVVYAGANDGMMHGFRSGSFSAANTYVRTYNDGAEVLAYMPGYIVNNIQNSTNTALNYSDPQYGHRFSVDAPPGTGDLFYNGTWHTWLVSGLGAGGPTIFALDVTDPDTQFSESAPGNTVIGEWSGAYSVSRPNLVTPSSPIVTNYAATLTCTGNANCATYHLGNTFGVPQIRRFHNGSWGAVFGNGFGSASGDAGIFVMLVDSSGGVTFRYLSAGVSPCSSLPCSNGNDGIAYTTPADLDGDHITDYVYAGDLLGNVWRFDLTSSSPANWAVTSGGALFRTKANQPITSKVIVASIAGAGNPHILVELGTGQQSSFTNTSAATYSTSTQTLYGVWDWNLSTWNTNSTAQYASLSSHAAITGTTNLQQQSIQTTSTATSTGTGSDYRTITNASVCYADVSGCTQFGWYMDLVNGNAYPPDPAVPQNGNSTYANNPVVYEQVIFSPILDGGAFLVNTTIPSAISPIMCFSSTASGWTMALDPGTGGSFATSFFGDSARGFLNVNNVATSNTTVPVSGIALGGTGSSSLVTSGTQVYLITQTVAGVGAIDAVTPPGGTKGSRLTWIQRR